MYSDSHYEALGRALAKRDSGERGWRWTSPPTKEEKEAFSRVMRIKPRFPRSK